MPQPITSTATAQWNGPLFTGSGSARLETSGAGEFQTNWKSRAEESGGTTTPEELIAAAHATCFAMQFSNELVEHGTEPTQLNTSAHVTFIVGEGITKIDLAVTGQVPNISPEDFARIAESAKGNCPVSGALAGVREITLEANLA